METQFKVGDEVIYSEKAGYFEDMSEMTFTIEEVDRSGWIWSSQFKSAYFRQRGEDVKNFHNPTYFQKSPSQIRADKLDDIGI